MARKLDKLTETIIRDFLKDKYNIPHIVAVWALKHQDIHVSTNTIINVRKKYEMKYVQDKKVHNTVQQARDKGIEITHDFLCLRCPQICEEHRQYLVAFHAKKDRRELPPVRVGGIAHVVHQILHA